MRVAVKKFKASRNLLCMAILVGLFAVSTTFLIFASTGQEVIKKAKKNSQKAEKEVIDEAITSTFDQTKQSNTQTPQTVIIPAGTFIFGSDRKEREYAYQLDQQAYGHSVTRDSKWYETEADRQVISTDLFEITSTPITNRQYSKFIAATNHPAPNVEKQRWQSYGLVHPYERTLRFTWKDNIPPKYRDNHPVVLVNYEDAIAYAKWLTQTTEFKWRLPTEIEWVKAARGPLGWRFPWGDKFDAKLLNSHDNGPFDTVNVGSLSQANSYGLYDAAGQVFEWIQTAPDAKRAWVKGGSWDDKGCGVCRPSARHSRPILLKHILIGFRLIKE